MRVVWVCSLVVALFAAESADAGTIYYDRASFLTDLGGPGNVTEDFESFATGPAANPLTILGGMGEILDTNPAITLAGNTIGGPSPSQAWISSVGAVGNPSTIRGVGNTALGFSALGFDFAHQLPGNTWTFNGTSGADVSVLFPAGPPILDTFIGWIGGPGETLNSAVWSGAGVIVDNMVGQVPEPVSLLLLGSGLLGIAVLRRRKRA